jgi:hypothetical protein
MGAVRYLENLPNYTASLVRLRCLLLSCCFRKLLFAPEHGGSTFLQKVGELLPDYTA